MIRASVLGLAALCGTAVGAQTLPEGLDGLGGTGDGPILQPTVAAPMAGGTLPDGLAGLGGSEGPVLQPTETAQTTASDPGFRFSGFVEGRYAGRLSDDPLQGAATVSELRFHLEAEAGRATVWTLALDAIGDAVITQQVDLERGTGSIDLREAHVFFRVGDNIDVRLGRQILTWGTGDLLFVNDLFPKDFVSFVAGRDDDYLKAPVDAIRISAFSDLANLELVAMAPGQTDRLVTGDRISFTDPATGEATDTAPDLVRPDEAEYAARLYRTIGTFETALYGYRGHWKSPAGQDPQGRATFPRLDVIGGSVRGPVLGGIGAVELGYYDSVADPDGSNPAIQNSDLRWLISYEREIARNTTLGAQYSVTTMQDYDAYVATLPVGQTALREERDIATLRLTRLFLNQTLTASAFVSHSPTWEDGNVRLNVDYAASDTVSLGAFYNHFYGEPETPSGQFKDASSLGVSARISF